MTTSRRMHEADVAPLLALRNDVPTQYALLADPHQNTADDVRSWVKRREDDPHALFWIIADETDAAIGFHQILAIDTRSRHGSYGIALAANARGRGHARRAMNWAARAAQEDGRLEKFVLNVRADNASAIGLYRSLGFRDVGVLQRHYFAEDRWYDVLVMEAFLSEMRP